LLCPKSAVRRAGAPLKDTDPQTQKPLTAAKAKKGVCPSMLHLTNSPCRGDAPFVRWTSPTPPLLLSFGDRQMLEVESSISPEYIAGRGYYTASRRADVPNVFKGRQRRLGLVIPIFSPSGATGFRLRPKRPISPRRSPVQPGAGAKPSRRAMDNRRRENRRQPGQPWRVRDFHSRSPQLRGKGESGR
jgi:hypothetical protein